MAVQRELRLGARTFPPGSFAVMAIINRTPDSFFDKGAGYATDRAHEAVDAAIEAGADLVDIGGVKAGYGQPVSETDEIARTVDFISSVRARHPEVVISIDTWRSGVARLACEAGADLINDTWGGHDPGVAEVAARYGAGLVCSHAGGVNPRTDPHRLAYDDVVADVITTVTGLAERATSVGVRPDGIVIDPTHDFGKNTAHSLALTRRLDELAATGWPVLVAVSNKDFIGETLDRPPGERQEGTVAALALSAARGARVFRVHDVGAARRTLAVVSAVSTAAS